MMATKLVRHAEEAGTLVAAIRRIVTMLLDQEWPRAYAEGLHVVVRQLIALETRDASAIDARLVADLLPVLDALERARAMALGAHDDERWATRFDRALDQLAAILERHGIHPDRPLGAEFDPKIHEAVGVEKTHYFPADRVIQIVERGWYLGPDQVRPSKVVVSKPA